MRHSTVILAGMFLISVMVYGCSSPKPVIMEEPADTPEAPSRPGEPRTETDPEKEPGPDEESVPYRTVRTITKPYTDIPETPREFRGVWIATVANIDWPSEPGLPVKQQKEELRAMMDRAAALNMNAVILQVRPAADAFYQSPFEPWSIYLTGHQGKAPDPFYDPLKFAVKEAHRRGLELHAWFNPFRAYHPSAEGELAPDHIKNLHPEMVLRYGNYYWLDPGQERVRQYSINIIADVVRRYDIDGVHLDDYFYPYPLYKNDGEQLPFPDIKSYERQRQGIKGGNRADWRRENVNNFIKRLNREIKLVDPHIRFGISPFGIWRPGYPSQVKGLDAFNRIYADARKWLRKGWVDYLAPQLYWPVDQKPQSFPVLLEWWHQQNNMHRHLWPGIYTSRLRSKSNAWPKGEIEQQIEITRSHQGSTGSIHFSMKALMNHSDSVQVLSELYPKEALVPATPWLSDTPPPRPSAVVREIGDRYVIRLKSGDDEGEDDKGGKHEYEYENTDAGPWLWVVKQRYGDHWETSIHPGWKKRITLPKTGGQGRFSGAVISAADELGNESAPFLVREIRVARATFE